MNEYEQRYWELREEADRKFDKWFGSRRESEYVDYRCALLQFQDFCVDVLTKLMENNSDVLERLKNV